mgnify:CR=1 FL=1
MKATELKIYIDILISLDPEARVYISEARDGDDARHELSVANLKTEGEIFSGQSHSLVVY